MASLAATGATIIAGPLATAAHAARPPKATVPVVTVTPASGKVLSPARVTNGTSLGFSWTVVTGQKYFCSVDAAAVSCDSGSVTAGASAPLADGAHSFSLRVKQSGARQATWTYGWTVRTAAPTQPTISYSPSSPTGNTTATISWSDADASVAGYTCELLKDNNVVEGPTSCGGAATTGSKTYSSLTDDVTAPATYVAKVWALDQFGSPVDLSSVTPGIATWTVDAHAPSTPTLTAFPDNPTASTSATFQWTASDNSGSVASYGCTLDGANVTPCSASGSTYSVGAGSHAFSVYAIDAAGNAGPSTPTYEWDVVVAKPASPKIQNGPAQPTTDVSDATFHFTGDGNTVAFLCSLDGASYSTCASPQSYNNLSDGGHTFTVEGEDAAGNVSDPSDSWNWTIDTSVNSPVVVSAPEIQTGPAAYSNLSNPTFTWVDLDPTAVNDQCSSDGGTTWSVCSSPLQVSVSGDGPKQFAVRSLDASNNQSPASVWSWTLDTTAPAAPTLTAKPADPTTATAATFQFSSEPGATLRCQLDGANPRTCVSPVSYQSLAVGAHTFNVSATDAAGNAGTTTSYSWSVVSGTSSSGSQAAQPATQPAGSQSDTTPPAVSLVAPSLTLTGPTTVTFSEPVTGLASGAARIAVMGTTSAVPTTVTCLDGTTAAPCTGTFTALRLTPVKPLTLGQRYSVVIDAAATHDAAGNASVASSTPFRAATSVDENNAVVNAAWSVVKNTGAYGGSLVREHLAGATASWTFTGTAVTWWTATGPDQGKADVLVDGVRKVTVNNYSAKGKLHVARVVKGLKKGKHTITIRVLGAKGAKAATGTFVSIDAFTVGRARTVTPTLVSSLRSLASSRFAAGHAWTGDINGESVTVAFRGTSVTWTAMRGVTQGKAAVYVDGVRKTITDDYAAKTSYGVRHTVGKLADKVHMLRIVILGQHHKGGKGNLVTIDRITVA